MDPTLIPFARSRSDRAIVDTGDVPRGKACGCICPSCLSQLIARKGNQKVWHFAHTAQGSGDRTEELCEFSWAASVRLMARQLLTSLDALQLPAAVFPLFTDGLVRRRSEPTVTLPGPEVISLDRVMVDATIYDVSVDAVVETGEGQWCVFFEHAGRSVPETLDGLASLGVRCIVVDLEGFASVLPRRSGGEIHRAILADFLINDLAHKRWTAHPGLEAARRAEKAVRTSSHKLHPSAWAWEQAM